MFIRWNRCTYRHNLPIHRSYHISGTQSRRYLCTKRKVIYFQFRRIGLFIRTGVDNTVSVVDIATFKESSKLTVGPNPGKIVAGPDETVYVATRGEDVEAGDYNFVKIDCRTNKVTQSNEKVQNFAIDGEIAYLYNYNYNT